MDQIFETGTQKIFSQIAQTALATFAVDPRRLHFDTTSVSVFGDYHLVDPPFEITYGYSKDKRPDLKQFLVSMLCVDRNIPILGTTTDGNASDKTLNNELLTNISTYMARHGLEPGAYVYVADSAFVTEDNLKKADGRQTWFLTRPAGKPTTNAAESFVKRWPPMTGSTSVPWRKSATAPSGRLPAIGPMTAPSSYTEKPTGRLSCIPARMTSGVTNASIAC